ncbi:MAG: hypothetical protein ACI89X_004444 [Planctomycetota bacterium]|jgi:hypothetical protein
MKNRRGPGGFGKLCGPSLIMIRLPLTFLLLTAIGATPLQDPEPVGFPVLAGYEYKEGMTLPKEVTNLNEKVVEIRGFMRREFAGSGPVNSFMLINDACGCMGTPMMNEIVFCTLPDGVKMELLTGVVTVTGKLYVGEEKEDGDVILIYAMDADTVTAS